MPGQSSRKVDGGRIPGVAEVTNCIEIRFAFLLPNTQVAHTRCFGTHEGSVIASAALANSLFNAITPLWHTRFTSFLAPGVNFEWLSVREMTSHTNPEWRSTVAALAGDGTGQALPQDVALVLTANCNERGRGAKGRMYLPGWSTVGNVGNGRISDPLVTAATGFGTDLRNALNAQALTACVAKPARQEYTGLTGAVHAARPAHVAQVLSYTCSDTHWDTQRRRDR